VGAIYTPDWSVTGAPPRRPTKASKD
jgi:hypothetical protein